MASYTMTLKEVIDMLTDGEAYSVKDRIEKGRTKLFDFDYPIFDSNYKKVFETHFIRKFFMREIGFETEGLFKFQLETWLLINMPYFNKLFESELIHFDPLVNSKTETTHTKKVDKDQSQTSQSDGSSQSTTSGNVEKIQFDRHLESQTPDSRLTITTDDGSGVIEYASSIEEKTGKDKTTSNVSGNDSSIVTGNANATINETEDYVQSRSGKIGVQSYSKMMMEYRNSLIRVENKIFDEMQELFILVY